MRIGGCDNSLGSKQSEAGWGTGKLEYNSRIATFLTSKPSVSTRTTSHSVEECGWTREAPKSLKAIRSTSESSRSSSSPPSLPSLDASSYWKPNTRQLKLAHVKLTIRFYTNQVAAGLVGSAIAALAAVKEQALGGKHQEEERATYNSQMTDK